MNLLSNLEKTGSSSNYYDGNEGLTETGVDDFREENDLDHNSDPSYDEVDKNDCH